MKIHFYKYQGTGNDFVLVDNRDGRYDELTLGQIYKICDRRFGVGADGFMMLNKKEGYDFEMKYFNSDGAEGSMCGNGGRCIVRFANDMGIKKTNYNFFASDGPHEAAIYDEGLVSLKMRNVDHIEKRKGDYILNTGSPHYVQLVSAVKGFDVYKEGYKIRHSKEFVKEGINVNFVEVLDDDNIIVRTFERGVENETYSCGTGVTAAALVFYHHENGFNTLDVETLGGKLNVRYHRSVDGKYERIWLKAPAEKVFEGDIDL